MSPENSRKILLKTNISTLFFLSSALLLLKKKKTRGNWPPQVVVEMTFGDPKDHETVR
jgi:hypothetical protein